MNNRSVQAARALLLAVFAGVASAQEYDPNFMAQKVYIRGIEVRAPAENRVDEIEIIGIGQKDNDFRSRTPLLLRGDHTPQFVDPEELYERRLGLYAAPAGETAVLFSTSRAEGRGEPAERATEPAAPTEPDEQSAAPVWPLLVALGFAAVFVVWWRRNKQILAQ